jgi:hypothetical protein
MKNFKLNRRAVLRSVVGMGALRLCPLEAMFDSKGNAYGQVAGAPKRFVLMYQGNGIPAKSHTGLPCRWVPTTLGANMQLNSSMAPMASLKAHMRIFSGMNIGGNDTPGDPHAEAQSWSLCGVGTSSPGNVLGGPTPDFVIAKALQQNTRISTLRVGIWKGNPSSPGRTRVSADDNGTYLAPEHSPQAVFTRLFGGFVPTPGEMVPTVDLEKQRQRLIVDYVKRDADRLRPKLGMSDRIRLDQHLNAVRDMERELFPAVPMMPPPPPQMTCVTPVAPGAAGDMSNDARAKAMCDLIAMAFACDLTRVVSYMANAASSEENLGFLGMPYAFHESISHMTRGQGYTTLMNELETITKWHLKWVEYLFSKLKAMPDAGGGSVLDNTLGVYTSEFGNSQHHSRFETPYLLVGGSRFITGNYHWRPSTNPLFSKGDVGAERNTKVWMGVFNTLGVPVNSWGGNTAMVPMK